jgi:hypothetical protein
MEIPACDDASGKCDEVKTAIEGCKGELLRGRQPTQAERDALIARRDALVQAIDDMLE